MALVDMGSLVGPEMGYAPPRHRATHAQPHARARHPYPAQGHPALEKQLHRIEADIPGAPAQRMPAMLPLGFPLITFSATSGTLLEATVQPQTLFQGRRISAQQVATGTTATGIVLLRNLSVGMKPINVSRNGVALSTFGAAAFDTDLLLPPAQLGNDITIQLQLVGTALTMTDTILVIVSLIGSGVL